MRTSRRVAVGLALAGAALPALGPALGQDRPESILPPGFGEPAPARTATPRPSASATDTATPATNGPTIEPLTIPTVSATPTPAPTVDPSILGYYELPPFARHPLDRVGPVAAGQGGFGADAWGRTDGGTLETLMRRLSAPLPSRWLSIVLRRALVAAADTPARLNGANFAAERAWLLLRMGESESARGVVQSVDNADYTPKLYQVALNAMLATGDPAGMCPIADAGWAATGERGWAMAPALCAGLTGQSARAAALLKIARRQRLASGIDLALARRLVSAGSTGRQAVAIDWGGQPLTPWRFGLAVATGVELPEAVMATTGPQVGGWRALAPGMAPAARAAGADAAAAQGVLSGAALVDLYAGLADADGDEPAPATVTAIAPDLTAAYADANADSRLAACRRLWGADVPYARLILTARAAARIPATRERAGDADRLVASMLTAGLTGAASRWRDVVPTGGDAWAMLALADPRAGSLRYSALASYAGGGDAALKQRLFFAGAAGLGLLARDDSERAAAALDVRIGAENSWTRAIDRAAADGEAGTVVLLSAIAMQTPAWQGVPPAALYRIVASLRAVGLEGEARMIAAEALARG